MKKLFVGVYNPSIILTYIGVYCSVAGMGLLLAASPSDSADPLRWTMILFVIAGICDLFDGRIARLCKRTDIEKRFGIQLDSLADTISFVALPASILLFVTNADLLSILIACFYTFAGIMRLGWFNVTTEENPGYFRGLPVTYSAVLFPILYVIWTWLSLPCIEAAFQGLFALVGLLFILNFRMKKPRLVGSILFGLLAIATVIALIIL